MEVIDLYNQLCGSKGWFRVDQYSEDLSEALQVLSDLDLRDFRTMFGEAIVERRGGSATYAGRRGAKLIRILWGSY